MKIIVNTSNIVVGGGVQVALSLINEFNALGVEHQFVIICSNGIAQQINQKEFSTNFKFYYINSSPARLISRKKIVNKLERIEFIEKPDVVFSVFGPSFWTPKAKHLMGFALPTLVYPESIYFQKLSLKKKIEVYFRVKYRRHFVIKNSNYYWCETKDVKDRMSRLLNISEANITVIGNTYSSFYKKTPYSKKISLPKREKEEFRLITISSNYPHKNLIIIKKVAEILINKKIKFFLTLPETDFKVLFGENNNLGIINLGVVEAKDCPYIYEQCDAMLMPTLLECFTATYPEAMVMRKPILTSNLSFARDICEDAACFFNPNDANDIAEKILNLVNDNIFYNSLIDKGLLRVSSFPSAKTRGIEILKTLSKIDKNTDA